MHVFCVLTTGTVTFRALCVPSYSLRLLLAVLGPSGLAFSRVDEEIVRPRLFERPITGSGRKFEVNHSLSLNVSHRPRRHLVFSTRPSNLMGVRAL